MNQSINQSIDQSTQSIRRRATLLWHSCRCFEWTLNKVYLIHYLLIICISQRNLSSGKILTFWFQTGVPPDDSHLCDFQAWLLSFTSMNYMLNNKLLLLYTLASSFFTTWYFWSFSPGVWGCVVFIAYIHFSCLIRFWALKQIQGPGDKLQFGLGCSIAVLQKRAKII